MISFTFHFSTFGSARVSLQYLSNKSTPLRLFNKHFALSDECAALLKCLFSFCLGGQPTVVYLTVNKQAHSLQLRASSPQWSLAEWHFSGGEKQTSSRFLFKLLSLTQVCAHLLGKCTRLVRGERDKGCSTQVGVFRLITDHYQLLSVCLGEEGKASLSHFKLTMTGIHSIMCRVSINASLWGFFSPAQRWHSSAIAMQYHQNPVVDRKEVHLLKNST